MSKKRNAQWNDYPKRKVDGKWLCRWCSNPCGGRRTSVCSGKCLHELLLITHPSYMRKTVFKRDKGICALCAMNTEAKRKELTAIKKSYSKEQYKALLKQMKIPSHRRSLWDADHIHPVIEGGGMCGLENMRTLCIWCHKKITALLRKKLAMERKCQNHGRRLK